MKVLWIWEIVVDKTYIIDSQIINWEKNQAKSVRYSLWGPVLSALKLLQNLWVETKIIWSIWDDHYRWYIENMLDKYSIKKELFIDKASKTNTIIINKKNWERTIIRDKDQNKKIREININEIKKADIIIFDRHEKEAFDFVMKNKNKNTKIILDPSNEISKKIIDMSKNIDYPIFPIETLKNMYHKYSLEESMKKLFFKIWKNLIITDGENGTHIFDWKKIDTIKAIKIKAVDTNWAWDVFRWWFAYWLLKNRDLKKTVEFSNIVAWLQCLKVWNLTATPEKKDIEKFII